MTSAADDPNDHDDKMGKGNDHKVHVTVITPSGDFPDDEPLKVNDDTQVAEVLKRAAKKLKLTNTSDWVAMVGDKTIDPNLTFREQHLSGTVEIDWHKVEGGGGASSAG